MGYPMWSGDKGSVPGEGLWVEEPGRAGMPLGVLGSSQGVALDGGSQQPRGRGVHGDTELVLDCPAFSPLGQAANLQGPVWRVVLVSEKSQRQRPKTGECPRSSRMA